MKRKSILTVLTLIGAVALPGLSSAAKERGMKPASSQNAPQGFVLVEEQVSIDMKEMPLAFMDEAITDYNDKNFGEAVGDLKAAARVMRSAEKQGLSSQAKSEMKATADSLDKTARDLRANAISSVAMLKSRLAEAAYHKAAYNRMRAASEWDKREMQRAGHDLDAATTALQYSSQWAGKEFAGQSRGAVEQARKIASKLVDNHGWTDKDVNTAFNDLANAEKSFGNNFTAKERAASETTEF